MRRLRSRLQAICVAILAITLTACGSGSVANNSNPPAAGATHPPLISAPNQNTRVSATTNAPTTTEQTPAAHTGSEVTGQITEMTWTAGPAPDKALKDLARLFEKTHPGTKINITILPYDQFAQKLPLMMSSGNPPDVFPIQDSAPRLVQEGKVIPLDKYIKTDPILSDPNQARTWANTMTKLDGKHTYGMQNGALCSMQLYYNRDLFDKAGVAYPNANWTWDDFLAAAKKLTIRQGGKTEQWGTDLGYLQGWDGGWQTMATSNGAHIMDTNFSPNKINLDDPAVIKSWQFMQDLIYKYKVAPPPSVEEALSQAGGPFLSGKTAMVPDGCWQASNYKAQAKFKLGMTLLPKGKAGRVDPVWWGGGGFAFMVSKASDNKDLAWEWLRWLTVDPKANRVIANSGVSCGAPILYKYDDLYSKAWKNVPGGGACINSIEGSKFFGIFELNWPQVLDTVINPAWDKFVHDKITAKELSNILNKEVNAKLK